MRNSLMMVLLVCVVLVAACADGGASEDLAQPTIASTTTVGGATTTAQGTQATTTTVGASESSTTVPSSTSSSTTTTTAIPLVPLDELELRLEVVASGFAAPVFAASPPGEDDRLFVVDQPGVIWVIDEGDPRVFLDIRESVIYGGERGLLGLAFDPDFSATGRFYVNYTASGSTTRISEFSATGDEADPASERVVLRVDQPARNHNGGMIAFGPDGYLWIGMGDGGGRDDRYSNGQDGQSLLGSMLRIDPTTDPYTVPDDNPGVVRDDYAPEVWAIGLRNPWRFSFDGADLWIADVGQNAWEEIDVVDSGDLSGLNFGWPRFEGTHCYIGSSCDDAGLVEPVYDYPHSEGFSVTGGYVYRGPDIPELDGHYVFADYGSGWIRSLTPQGEMMQWLGSGSVSGPSSFGIDAAGEILVTSLNGSVYRLVRG